MRVFPKIETFAVGRRKSVYHTHQNGFEAAACLFISPPVSHGERKDRCIKLELLFC